MVSTNKCDKLNIVMWHKYFHEGKNNGGGNMGKFAK